MCLNFRLLGRRGASEACPRIFGFLVWFGVVGGTPLYMARISEPDLGVSRAMTRYDWYGGGMRRVFMVE